MHDPLRSSIDLMDPEIACRKKGREVLEGNYATPNLESKEKSPFDDLEIRMAWMRMNA